MIRWLGALITVMSGAGIGFYFSAVTKGRLDNLKDIKKTMIRLRREIEYAGSTLPEAIESASSYAGKDFNDFYQALVEKLVKMDGKMFHSIWRECVETQMGDASLRKRDKLELIKFGEGIGYLDKTMQISTIDLYLSELEQEIDELSGEVREKTRLYNLLGVTGGVFLTILFI